MDVYGLIHSNVETRKKSTSGGAFSALAEKVIADGGCVYGACFDESWHVHHIKVTDFKELDKLRGVKYVQSRLDNCFKQCKDDLTKNKKVMFVGTPCQIAGLKRFLGELQNNSNLLLCDLICHGTPDAKFWNDYVKYFEEMNGPIEKIIFRDKITRKWRDCKGVAIAKGKALSIEEYTRLFYLHDIVNERCFKCNFSNLNRQGDITFGDFWGIENKHPEYDDGNGVSLILCNSKRGQDALDALGNDVLIFKSDLIGCRQPQLYNPTKKPVTYNHFQKVYKKKGIIGVIKMVNNPISLYSIVRRVEKNIKSFLKKILRK